MAYQVTYGAPAVLPVSFGELGPEYGNEPIGLQDGATIDVNGDGYEDVFIMGFTGSGYGPQVPIKLLVSNGTTLVDRTSQYLPDAPISDGPRNVFVADFNGDGRDDVFINNAGTEAFGAPYPGGQNRLLLSNLTTGVYDDATATHLPQASTYMHGGGAGDFDGDGDIDVFLNSLGQQGAPRPYLMLNDGHGVMTIVEEWDPAQPDGWFSIDVNANFYYAHVFDFDGDAFADIWTSGLAFYVPGPEVSSRDFRGLVNDRNGHLVLSNTFGSFPSPANPDNEIGEWAFDSDFDKDGDRDLFVWISGPNYLALYLNDGQGNFTDESLRINTPDGIGGFNMSFCAADLDGDGDDDLFLPGDDNGAFRLLIYENNGDGTFKRVEAGKIPEGLRFGIRLVDVNGDGLKDFLTDITYHGAWQTDHSKQFTLHLGKLDVAVTRNGWATDDRIFGGSKNDTLRGLAGDDFLQGNAGDDVMRGGAGKDALDGRAGFDTADYSDKSLAVSVTLPGSGAAKVKVNGVIEDTLRRVENVTGGSGADTLIGDAFGNRLIGNAGVDTLKGQGGNDHLKGGTANDILVGGAGFDTADYSDAGKAVFVTLNANAAVKVRLNGVNEDTISGIENVVGGSKNDALTGDILFNRLIGNAGVDILKGGAGNDFLVGGRGRDLMSGNPGADDFVIESLADLGRSAATRDRIEDFAHLVDDIDLSAIDANGPAAGHRFKFLAVEGAVFSNVRGELRWFQINVAGTTNDKTIVEGDINGDRKADFQIELAGLKTLTEADFFL